MDLALDPLLPHTAAAAVAMVLLSGAWQKLRDLDGFEAALEGYALLPAALLAPFARLLPLAEIAAGLALALEPLRPAGVSGGLALLAVVTGAVTLNLLRGRRHIDCGCGGLEDEQTLSWPLVARNAVLALLLVVAALPAAPRELGLLDFVSLAGAAATLFGLYLTASQLIANQPRLAGLRRRRVEVA